MEEMHKARWRGGEGIASFQLMDMFINLKAPQVSLFKKLY